ncbi:Transglycosylase SLT domain-containing protein [Nakamurella panacisegetis]|uniref:Transglycosylase SLT domain-containing protein n=2 Tax=Nakamurella panacisegetis TaxID=1090615 RepID=A0A1H0JVR0_9ACTN|nr:Transglycosylase SLT domain-containing protein [Nakamurella panacisegetis]
MIMFSRKPKWVAVLAGAALLVALPVVPGTASAAAPAGPSQAAATARPAGSFVPLASTRILDTRTGNGARGPIAAGGSFAVLVLGRGGVPSSGVSAVMVNITVANPTVGAGLTAYADGTSLPGTTNVSFAAGQTVANLAMVPVGTNGQVRIHISGRAGAVQVLLDVSGYYTAGAPTAAGTFKAMVPTRLADTRVGTGVARAKVASSSSLNVRIGGAAGLPQAVAAVAVDVTTIPSSVSGFITVFPTGSARPNTPAVNFRAGRSTTSLVVVPLWSDGRISLFNGSTGAQDMVVDLVGYYLNTYSGQIGTLQTIGQQRVVDMPASGATLAAQGTLTVPLAGRYGIPNAGVSAVAVNVTVVDPAHSGDIRAISGSAVPSTSNINFGAHVTTSNLIVLPLVNGAVRLFNDVGAGVHLQVSIVGVFWDGSGAARCNAVPTDPNGTAVTRWNPLVQCILAVLAQSQGSTTVNDVDTVIQYESSGDPNAINRWDLNWQAGHPSEGLIQVIQPTFDTWHSPLLPNNLLNPAANLYAGLNYAIHTYGSIHNIPGLVSLRSGGPYKGYIAKS